MPISLVTGCSFFFPMIIISHICIEFDFQVQKLEWASPLEPKSLFPVGLVQLLEVSRNFHGGLLQLIVAQFNIAITVQGKSCHQHHHHHVQSKQGVGHRTMRCEAKGNRQSKEGEEYQKSHLENGVAYGLFPAVLRRSVRVVFKKDAIYVFHCLQVRALFKILFVGLPSHAANNLLVKNGRFYKAFTIFVRLDDKNIFLQLLQGDFFITQLFYSILTEVVLYFSLFFQFLRRVHTYIFYFSPFFLQLNIQNPLPNSQVGHLHYLLKLKDLRLFFNFFEGEDEGVLDTVGDILGVGNFIDDLIQSFEELNFFHFLVRSIFWRGFLISALAKMNGTSTRQFDGAFFGASYSQFYSFTNQILGTLQKRRKITGVFAESMGGMSDRVYYCNPIFNLYQQLTLSKMRIKVLCAQKVATLSHRGQQQFVDVAPTESIAIVKVKCSLVYQSIDINDFDLTYNHQVLKDQLLISDLLKQNTSGAQITFILRAKDTCCVIC